MTVCFFISIGTILLLLTAYWWDPVGEDWFRKCTQQAVIYTGCNFIQLFHHFLLSQTWHCKECLLCHIENNLILIY